MTRTSGLTGAPPATWPRGGAAESRRRSHRRPHATVGRQLELAAGPAGTIVRGDPGLRRHGRADGTGCRAHDARTSRSGSTRRRRPGPRRSPAASTTHRDDRRQPRPHQLHLPARRRRGRDDGPFRSRAGPGTGSTGSTSRRLIPMPARSSRPATRSRPRVRRGDRLRPGCHRGLEQHPRPPRPGLRDPAHRAWLNPH